MSECERGGPEREIPAGPAAYGAEAASPAQPSGGKPQEVGFRAKVAVRLGGKRVREAQGSPEPIQSGRPNQGRVMDGVPVSAVERAHFLMCFLRNLGRARLHPPLHDHTSERQFLIFGVYETTEPYPLGLRSRSPARNQNQNGNL